MADSIKSFNEFIEHIKSGNINDVIRTFKNEYVEMEDEFGRPIHHACQYGHLQLVKLLIDRKCNIEAINNNGKRPIHVACVKGHREIVKLLMQHKCNIDVSDNKGKRPIHFECEVGHFELVKLLLQNKCNIEASSFRGKRSLHFAVENGHTEIVKLLLEHKCNIESNNYDGMTPLHYACQYGFIEISKLLLEHKCKIDARDDDGMTPLHYACQFGHIKLVKLLLKNKDNINTSDDVEMKPIHLACQYGYINIVKLLLENKCDINSSDDRKKLPLHLAYQYDHVEIVKLLLEHKCNIVDFYDELVKINKSQEIIDLLTAAITNQSMCSIALAMSLECRYECPHTSCFITMSVDDFKRKSDLIGTGAYGKVYRCSQFVRTFALKIIKINDATKNIEENIEEYRHILRHDHIVQYFGAITESNHTAIFMEFIAGESLHDLIKDHGAIPHNTISRYSKQILLGIAFLHQKKILHRDIKPQNILLNYSGEWLKLCDFGISRSLMTISTTTTQTAHTGCGTPNYLAPEVIKEEPYSFPADIWSLGATIVEMLTGHPPFHKMNLFAVIFKLSKIGKIKFKPAQPMSDKLKIFLNQMLQRKPSKRATALKLLDNKFINRKATSPKKWWCE